LWAALVSQAAPQVERLDVDLTLLSPCPPILSGRPAAWA